MRLMLVLEVKVGLVPRLAQVQMGEILLFRPVVAAQSLPHQVGGVDLRGQQTVFRGAEAFFLQTEGTREGGLLGGLLLQGPG